MRFSPLFNIESAEIGSNYYVVDLNIFDNVCNVCNSHQLTLL
jgi:hypothetical protein